MCVYVSLYRLVFAFILKTGLEFLGKKMLQMY